MNNSNCTRMPWLYNNTGEFVNGLATIEVYTPSNEDNLGEWIARVRGDNEEQRIANARLIAAAPVLLAELVKVRAYMQKNGITYDNSDLYNSIDSAIKQATNG